MGGNVEAYYDAMHEKAAHEERISRNAVLMHNRSPKGWVRWSATSPEYQQAMYDKAKAALDKQRNKRGGQR